MTLFSRKKPAEVMPAITREEALAGIPAKNPTVKIIGQDDGTLMLSYTLALRPIWGELLKRFTGKAEQETTKKLVLDQMGSQVWQLIDGKRSVREIILSFAGANNIGCKEAETATTSFLRELGKRKLIAIG
ncbi:PqqD family protein [Desulfotalea psychrophila]|uniref:PqqD family protein n=1 Tax=Desulfotalea psychrophila TaxID=84980 RepID=UPI000674939C|nr:PqqD family protein [Desulfotalea psychrophila]